MDEKQQIQQLRQALEALKEALEKEQQIQAFEKKEDAQHIWGRSNPLTFPPMCYTLNVAKVNQPFLIFNIRRNRPSCALARKPRMKESVVCYAQRKAFLRRIQEAESIYKNARKELHLRPWHLSLLEGMKLLTKPSKEALEAVIGMEREGKRWSSHSSQVEEEKVEAEETSDDDDEDEDEDFQAGEDLNRQEMFIHLGEEEEKVKVQMDAEEEEEAETEQANADGATTSTSRASGYLEHEALQNVIAVKVLDMKVGKPVVVLVIECKVPLSAEAIYQALCYAFTKGLQNLVEGVRVAPVHVMAWSDSRWTYAVMDIYGAVQLRNGVVMPESYQDFIGNQRTRSKYMKQKPEDFKESKRFTQAKLEALLQSRRKMLQLSCPSHRNIDYPDGLYLVGDVYVNTDEKYLPHGDSCCSALSVDAMLFYETLMRIVVGDTVLSWTEKDIDEIVAVREEINKRKLEAVTLAPPSKRQKT